jgi:predicted MPP superfamily phosphohydrolase
MRIAVTADLHYGHHRLGDEATELLRGHLEREPVDLLLFGGDIGTAEHFGSCLALFADLPCRRALVPGNHDLWVLDNDTRGDSLHVYQQHLPGICAAHHVHYLDLGPLILPEADLAVVGSINWYDYSWSIEQLRAEVPDWQWHLANKAFTRGRHNDGRFIRWASDDVSFTKAVVATFRRQLEAALEQVGQVIVLTHHPALHGLAFPREGPPRGLDPLLWDAFSGNTAMEEILREYRDRIAFIFSGHTHRATEGRLDGAVGFNVGGDYHFKRMLIVDWPGRDVHAHVFGDPGRRH